MTRKFSFFLKSPPRTVPARVTMADSSGAGVDSYITVVPDLPGNSEEQPKPPAEAKAKKGKKKEKKEEAEKKDPPVPFRQLFRYATPRERLLLVFAALCATIQGASW